MSDTAIHDDLDEDDLDLQEGETESDLVKRLRSKIKSQGKEIKDLRPLKIRVAEFEVESSLTKAFNAEELKQLSERQRAALIREVGDDKSPEALRKAAEEFNWVEAVQSPGERELEGHERIENAGNGANASAATKLDADTVGEWPMDKMMRFRGQHPDAWEQIKRGETVTGIAF